MPPTDELRPVGEGEEAQPPRQEWVDQGAWRYHQGTDRLLGPLFPPQGGKGKTQGQGTDAVAEPERPLPHPLGLSSSPS